MAKVARKLRARHRLSTGGGGKKYAGLGLGKLRRRNTAKRGKRRLRKVVADLSLDKNTVKDVVRRTRDAGFWAGLWSHLATGLESTAAGSGLGGRDAPRVCGLALSPGPARPCRPTFRSDRSGGGPHLRQIRVFACVQRTGATSNIEGRLDPFFGLGRCKSANVHQEFHDTRQQVVADFVDGLMGGLQSSLHRSQVREHLGQLSKFL